MCLIKKLKKQFFRPCSGQVFGLYSRQVGFTLVELLVSIFIITLISTIFLTNYHSTSKRSELIMATQRAASNIRLSQNYSLGSKEFEGSMPEGGWGIYFDTQAGNNDYYIIYADNDDNQSYDSGEEYQTIELPNGIIIDDIIIDGTSRSRVCMTFEPPDPTVYLCRDSGLCATSYAEIILMGSNGTKKTIFVNIFGLVDIVD